MISISSLKRSGSGRTQPNNRSNTTVPASSLSPSRLALSKQQQNSSSSLLLLLQWNWNTSLRFYATDADMAQLIDDKHYKKNVAHNQKVERAQDYAFDKRANANKKNDNSSNNDNNNSENDANQKKKKEEEEEGKTPKGFFARLFNWK